MPKTHAEVARIHIARKRERAREAGLCYTCCKVKPRLGVICAPCNRAALERKRRKRQREREHGSRGASQVLAAHERAGDIAWEHGFHDGAARHYRDALGIGYDGAPLDFRVIGENNGIRITEKLTNVLVLGEHPSVAGPYIEHLLAIRAKSGDAAKEIDLLERLSGQVTIEKGTEATLPLQARAIAVAEANGDAYWRNLTNVTMASTLFMLGRFEESEKHLERVPAAERNLVLQRIYHQIRGQIASARGDGGTAYEEFEKAGVATREDTTITPSQETVFWGNYASSAMDVGDFERAKSYFEQALLITRRYNIGWHIPLRGLDYAEILMRLGEWQTAHGYLLEALATPDPIPMTVQSLVSIGIPIALMVQDESALTKCSREDIIDRTFQSGEPAAIGSLAAGFALLYLRQGREAEAQRLVHHALELVPRLRGCLTLPLAAAQCGSPADIFRARELLEARSMIPATVPMLDLFDAYIAERNGNIDQSVKLADEAAQRFDQLGWYGFADTARSLASPANVPMRSQVRRQRVRPFDEMASKLTAREQEVVALVLRGLTNREVAAALSISKYTVESHMSTIMERLGIRSRHQLGGVFVDEPGTRLLAHP